MASINAAARSRPGCRNYAHEAHFGTLAPSKILAQNPKALSIHSIESNTGETHTRHEFEHGGLGFLEQTHNFLQALEHRVIVSNGTGHPAGKVVSQIVIDV